MKKTVRIILPVVLMSFLNASDANKPEDSTGGKNFKESIRELVQIKLKNIENGIKENKNAQAVQQEVIEQKVETERKIYPNMVGGYKITHSGKVIEKRALAIDPSGNKYYLSKKNNHLVKDIKSDHIEYKDEKGQSFKSSLILSNKFPTKDDEIKVDATASINNKNITVQPTKSIAEKIKNGVAPTMNTVVKEFTETFSQQ